MKSSNHLVIMAGGIGSRFWPISTSNKPKQFIDVLGCGKTLLQLTAERFGDICPKENIWVLTSAKYASMVKEQLPMIPEENILLEPCRRNTAPCIAYAAWKIKKKDMHANMVVTPSDHFVSDTVEFRRVINSSLKFVADSDAILTLGIKPTRPETGYGYIEAVLGNSTLSNKEVFRVDSFKEKPDLDTAKAYITKNNFYWNSGIFIWNVQTIVNAFRVYQSPIANIFESLLPVYYTQEEQSAIDEKFPECRNISVDYAILERAEEIFVFPADFGWSDLGTWGSLYSRLAHDLNGNAIIGKNVEMCETHNCIVHTTENKRVVLIGLDDCIVAEQNDELLICKIPEEGRIKDFSDK
ncbi:MAG: mannose-1-phosphate guanylyltransferase [Bacteroidaceae bacterium]|nr:mannose-1-phosphate guanylyltransferase [Bacteroidaceae bacterium]MBQ6694157.1 mannose-1-phosphate guanylyltransferase [Bacteroidaceae bacterium]MBR7166680.1 mannose-1-phosphate guanylyltransferase [Bacteroidaceae bacterium]